MGRLVLSAVGDVMLSKPLSRGFSDALTILNRVDVATANLEAPFTSGGDAADKWVALRQDPILSKEYVKIGFRVLNIANNHMLDYGVEGLLSTIDVLRKNGILYVGGGVNLEEALSHKIFKKNGISIAFLGCASTLPGNSIAGRSTPGLAPLRVRTTYYIEPEMEKEQPGTPPVIFTEVVQEDLDRIIAAVKKAKSEADFVVLSIHWGMAYQENILDYQLQAARAFIDAGAKLILGHHPHRVQAVERYGKGFIFYSLGDFFFDISDFAPINTKWRHWPPKVGMWSKSDDSLLVKTVFDPNGDTSIDVIPCSKGANGQPVILQGAKGRKLLQRLKGLSEGTDLKIKDDVAHLE
ncbi:MAG: CapA family protein [Nitrososphaerales archaeon]